jgi:hypothetical protein
MTDRLRDVPFAIHHRLRDNAGASKCHRGLFLALGGPMYRLRQYLLNIPLFVYVVCQVVSSQLAYGKAIYVLHVTVDGLRGDRLQSLMESAPGDYPNFARLQSEGAFTFNARSDFTHTETIPTHGSILTGRPVTQPARQGVEVPHGYVLNSPDFGHTIHTHGNPAVTYFSSTFDVVHDHGLTTSFFVGKARLFIYADSWDANSGAPDMIGEDNGRAKIDRIVVTSGDTDGLVTNFVTDMQTDPYNYSLIHITDPDSAGHRHGFSSADYDASVAVADAYLGRLFDLIDRHAELRNKTSIVMVSDHGGGVPDNDHTVADAIENYKIPLAIWGSGIPAGVDAYDLFSNRFDPGDGRPDYDSDQQPLWNGDTANIAIGQLGLGPIPGSTLVPIPEPTGFLLVFMGLVTLATKWRWWPRQTVGLAVRRSSRTIGARLRLLRIRDR